MYLYIFNEVSYHALGIGWKNQRSDVFGRWSVPHSIDAPQHAQG